MPIKRTIRGAPRIRPSCQRLNIQNCSSQPPRNQFQAQSTEITSRRTPATTQVMSFVAEPAAVQSQTPRAQTQTQSRAGPVAKRMHDMDVASPYLGFERRMKVMLRDYQDSYLIITTMMIGTVRLSHAAQSARPSASAVASLLVLPGTHEGCSEALAHWLALASRRCSCGLVLFLVWSPQATPKFCVYPPWQETLRNRRLRGAKACPILWTCRNKNCQVNDVRFQGASDLRSIQRCPA